MTSVFAVIKRAADYLQTIIATALPVIAEHFHSSATYTWIGSVYEEP